MIITPHFNTAHEHPSALGEWLSSLDGEILTAIAWPQVPTWIVAVVHVPDKQGGEE